MAGSLTAVQELGQFTRAVQIHDLSSVFTGTPHPRNAATVANFVRKALAAKLHDQVVVGARFRCACCHTMQTFLVAQRRTHAALPEAVQQLVDAELPAAYKCVLRRGLRCSCTAGTCCASSKRRLPRSQPPQPRPRPRPARISAAHSDAVHVTAWRRQTSLPIYSVAG